MDLSFKHTKLRNYILEEISNRNWRAGAKISSENVLSQRFSISRNTVRQAIQSLVADGYLYSVQGKGSFVKGANPLDTKKIALLIYDIDYVTTDVTSRMIKGISDVLVEHGYVLDILASHRKFHDEDINKLKANYAGILIGAYQIDESVLQEWSKANINYLFIKNYIESYKDRSIRIDYEYAGFSLAEHLITHGHRELSLIKSELKTLAFEDFYSGVTSACLENGACLRKKNMLVFDAGDSDFVEKYVDMILLSEERVTGIICPGDYLAYQVICELKKRNIKVPEDIGVTGLNNSAVSAMTSPSITTFDVNSFALGESAARLMLKFLKGGALDIPAPIRGELYIRESS